MPAPQHRMPNLRQQEPNNRTRGVTKSIESTMVQACDEVENLVRENPASSAFVTFAVGVGLGVALVALLKPARRPPAFGQATWAHLRDAVSQALPDALSQYMHK
jgi:hypothetical protein